MNEINHNLNSHSVCFIDKELEVIWSSRSRGDTKKACHMVTKTSVVSMLLNGHQLYDIITCFLNSWKDMLSVFSVRRNLSILLSHTNMGFVNSHGVISIRRLDRVDMFPFMLLFRWWVPVHAIKQGVSLNLHHSPS